MHAATPGAAVLVEGSRSRIDVPTTIVVITKLAGPVTGKVFRLLSDVDIYSRFMVGAHVHATESGVLAVETMRRSSAFMTPRTTCTLTAAGR